MADNIMKLGLILSGTDKMSRVVGSAVDKSSEKLKKLSSAANKIGGAVSVLGIAALGTTLLATADAAGQQFKANKRLEQVFKSMWGDSGAVRIAAKRQTDFAESLSLELGVDANIIKQTQAKIATFQHLSNASAIMKGTFERATRAAIDMAATGFGEATQNAVTLGKALEDPMNMATALKRMGTLTAKDIVDIKAVMAVKGLAAAQETMLKAVERQVGGVAAATATSGDIMRESWHRVNIAVGEVFLPTLKKGKKAQTGFAMSLVDIITKNAGVVRALVYTSLGVLALGLVFKGVIGTIGVFSKLMIVSKYVMYGARMAYLWTSGTLWYYTSVLKASTVWTKIAAAGQWLFNAALSANPIGLIIIGIVALIAAVVICWKKFAAFRAVIKTVWDTVKGFGNILKDYVLDRIKGIITGVGSLGRAIGLLFKGHFKEAFNEAGKGVKALSGYDAKMKAISRTKTLVTGISSKYTTILAKEKEAEKPKSAQMMQAHASSISSKSISNSQSNSHSVVYSPTVNLSGGTIKDKEAFAEMLKKHKNDIIDIMSRERNRNTRLSFGG